jgi:hypothetical protein
MSLTEKVFEETHVHGPIKFQPQSRQSAKLFSSRRNWDSPNPSPAGECAPPPRFWRGGGAAPIKGIVRETEFAYFLGVLMINYAALLLPK